MAFPTEEGTPSAADLAQTDDANLTGQDLLDGQGGEGGDDGGGSDGGGDTIEDQLARGGEQRQGDDRPPRDLTRAVNLYREEARRATAENAELRAYQARAEAERAAMNQRFQEIQARRAMEEAQRQVDAQPQDPEPDPIADPDGHDQWEKRQAAAASAALQQQIQQTQQAVVQQQQRQVVGELFSQLGNFELRFAATTAPDYQQAFDHLVGALAYHYKNLGYDDGQIWGEEGALVKERERFIRSCLELKTDGTVFPDGKPYRWLRDPALEIYQAAHRMGYGAAAGGGARPVAARPTVNGRPVNNNRTEALERARRGSAGAGGRGGETRGQITEADIAGMSEREMAYLLKNDKGALDRAMGRR